MSESRWGDAKDWLDAADEAGYETGPTAKPNSIVVYSGYTYGHVALVTAVNGDKMTVDEAGRTLDCYQKDGGIATESNRNTSGAAGGTMGNGYTVKGYIYLPVAPLPRPTRPKTSPANGHPEAPNGRPRSPGIRSAARQGIM